MKSLKILLAVVVIIIASNALSGCAKAEKDTPKKVSMSELGMARIEAATELKKTVELKMKEISRKGNEVQLQLFLYNPHKVSITSVEAWLTYNPKILQGVDFKSNAKDLELAAPYPNGFDADRGLFKLGRSTTHPFSSESLVLADLTFQLNGDNSATLEAFDYRLDLSGHNSVNVMRGKNPVNMLIKPESPLFMVKK